MRALPLVIIALTGCREDGVSRTDTQPITCTIQDWHADGDGDGYGSWAIVIAACEAPDGYVSDGTDCDDSDPSASPGLSEQCDGIDNNCDGEIDEGLATTFFIDYDADGYGSDAYVVDACEVPEGYVDNNADCNDLSPLQNPGVEELCGDGIDNDCDGAAEDTCAQLIEDGTALLGERAGEGGFRLATGDVNGDGDTDYLLGVSASSNDGGTEFDGALFLALGPLEEDRRLSESDAAVFADADTKAVLGYQVSVPGDIDGDGRDDVLVTGTQARDSDNVVVGVVALFSGSTLTSTGASLSLDDADRLWFGSERRDYLGAGMVTATEDGETVLFAGASGRDDSRGVVYLLDPTISGSPDDISLAQVTGEDQDDRLGLGRTLATADLNGDGDLDLIIGAPARETDDGGLYICEGPLSGSRSAGDCAILLPADKNDQLGARVAAAGDIDGDGIVDVWTAASSRDAQFINDGEAYLISGRSSLDSLSGQTISDSAAATVFGLDSDDQIGAAIATGEDMDGDGFADALIAAKQLGQIEQGVAMLFYGPLEGTILSGLADEVYTSIGATDQAGSDLMMLPELGALLIDAPENDLLGINTGATWLVTLP